MVKPMTYINLRLLRKIFVGYPVCLQRGRSLMRCLFV